MAKLSTPVQFAPAPTYAVPYVPDFVKYIYIYNILTDIGQISQSLDKYAPKQTFSKHKICFKNTKNVCGKPEML